jgi:hypothetical protein
MIAHTLLWENIFQLLDQQIKYNIDADLHLLKQSSEQMLSIHPDSFKAQHAYAEYHCRITCPACSIWASPWRKNRMIPVC